MAEIPEVMSNVQALMTLDETYASIQKELRDKINELRKQYESKFDALVADRTVVLSKPIAAAEGAKATPGIPSFWLDVLANSEEFADDIEEYDEPVLEYLESIEARDIDPEDEDKGFILTFKFNENEYFTNKQLTKVYTTARANEYTDQLEIVKIESDKIEWNQAKDVTVQAVAKKKSGKKKGGVSLQPRPSFFRYFRDMDQDNLPSELGQDEEEYSDDEEMDDLERLQMFMEHDWDKANTLKELIIPRAIRWYTGEAVHGMEEDDEEDDEDDEDDEEEDEDEDDDEEQPSKKDLFKNSAQGKNPEECKQQ